MSRKILTLVLISTILIISALVFVVADHVDADDDPIWGLKTTTVTIIEFGDFQDPFSRFFWENTLPQIKDNLIDDIKYIM